MVSQLGPASGRLNISSPLKERGFHVSFSDQQEETALVKHFDGFFSWLYLLDRDIGEVHLGVTPSRGRLVTPNVAPSYPRLSMDFLNRYRTIKNKKAAYTAAFRLIINCIGCRWIMNWWRAGELNPRPRRCERRALPTELAPHAWKS